MTTTNTGIRTAVRRAPNEGRGPASAHNRFASAPARPAPARPQDETDRLLDRSHALIVRLRQAVEARSPDGL